MGVTLHGLYILRWAATNMRVHIRSLVALGIGALYPFNFGFTAEQTTPQEVTKVNWEHHPRIVEVRKIYNEIQSKLARKQLRYQKKDYSVLPESCRGTYPMEYLAIATDGEGRVRVYTTAQRISHGDLLTTHHYYDEKGRLRFVYMTNKSDEFATIENRVYLDEKGKVFWDVKTEAKKITFGEITQDPWVIKNTTNEGTLATFKSAEVKCSR